MSTTPLVDPAAAATGTLPEPCVLLKLGEVVLKGGNRQQFERMLQANIRRAIAGTGGQVRLWQRDGVMVIRIEHDGPAAALTADRIAERARDIMGIARVCRAVRVAKDPDAAIDTAVALMAGKEGSFAVRARRRDKRFGVTSAELAIRIGARVQQEYGYPVNLRHPDTALFVEVDQREVFVYTEGYPGQGGLPVGMSGRGLVLMSGGIDSPVAAYRMMRRGLRCDFLHFSGMPLTGPESVYKAYGLMHQLDRFQGGSRLFVVAFGKAQQRLASSGASRLQIVAQRRLMLKTGEVLVYYWGGRAGDRRLAGAGEQPDADQPRRPRRRGRAAHPAPADRLRQAGDHGGGAPHPHSRPVRTARPGLLHPADAAACGDPGADR
jgi:thiamine biosynthesis protein ThiI